MIALVRNPLVYFAVYISHLLYSIAYKSYSPVANLMVINKIYVYIGRHSFCLRVSSHGYIAVGIIIVHMHYIPLTVY